MEASGPERGEAKGGQPPRVLVVVPSWVGDAVMATPALRLLRRALPGTLIGGLVRPGIDAVLAGLDVLDEVHVERASGVMGPKFVAARLRPRRYDVALLLTNSFSTALVARIAGIPRRVGYSRDGRGLLLTDRLEAPRRPAGGWAPVPAVAYYWHAACALLEAIGRRPEWARSHGPGAMPQGVRLELVATPEDVRFGAEVLARAGVPGDAALAVLNPGGNNPAKRWPAERFVQIGRGMASRGAWVLVNGSPAEAELAGHIARGVGERAASLPEAGGTIGSLKGVLASGRCRVMLTNDTGPRHMAAALGVPVVSLFGPTDHRWTTIPTEPGMEEILLADPTLPESEVADDHPERCRVERIEVEAVEAAVDRAWRAGETHGRKVSG